MVGKVIISHGDLAEELLRSARRIVGPLPDFVALNVSWEETPDQLRQRIGKAIDESDQGDGVLLLVDMFGNTPCKVALELCRPGEVELIGGVNLPLVVRLGCERSDGERSLTEVTRWAREKARQSICLGSAVSVAKPARADRRRSNR